jgi:mediator of replication checkpoint protein 1
MNQDNPSHNHPPMNGETSSRSSSPQPQVQPHRRRTNCKVSDRLALLRRTVSSSSSSSSHSSKLAFHVASSESDQKAFKYGPPPLRRTTTASSSTSSISTSGSSLSDKGIATTLVRTAPLTNRGSVNYYTAARELERARELNRKGKGSRALNELLARRDGPSKLDGLARLPHWE